MAGTSPIDLLFGGMKKLAPGSDEDTLAVLRRLPDRRFATIVDAGCGTGRQTLALARKLGTPVHAVDTYEPFLAQLIRSAQDAGLGDLVVPHCMDMNDIPAVFPQVDLLWSEGAAYNIGFGHALQWWASAIRSGGFAVVSELCWLHDEIPDTVKDFFANAYPDMRSIQRNVMLAQSAGYEALSTHTLPRETWVQGYYDVLRPRAQTLLTHEDRAVRELAVETLHEIAVFELSDDSYGYVFFVLQRV